MRAHVHDCATLVVFHHEEELQQILGQQASRMQAVRTKNCCLGCSVKMLRGLQDMEQERDRSRKKEAELIGRRLAEVRAHMYAYVCL